MRGSRITRFAAAVAASVAASGSVLVLAAGPAAAEVGTVAQLETTCTTVPSASFNQAPDGQVRGFVGTGCGDDRIDYVTRQFLHPASSAVPTPYHGVVLATAQDATWTYLLYRAADGVRVTKVSHAAGFTGGALLSKASGGGLEGALAARGGRWLAVWTEPKTGGGFALHQAGSHDYVVSPKDRLLPAGAGVDDSAPVLAPAPTGSGYLLAFSRHDAKGYHLMLASGYPRTFAAKAFDTSTENPQASIIRAGRYVFMAWVHNTSIRLAINAGPNGTTRPLYQAPVPQAPGTTPATNPRVGTGCGRLFVAYQADTENSGQIYVNTGYDGRWVQHLLPADTKAAPVLAGIAAHCEAGGIEWTSASRVLSVMVA